MAEEEKPVPNEENVQGWNARRIAAAMDLDWVDSGAAEHWRKPLSDELEHAIAQFPAYYQQEVRAFVSKHHQKALAEPPEEFTDQARRTKFTRASISRILRHILAKHPELQAEIAEKLLAIALGKGGRSSGDALKGIQVILDRIDGPVVKKVDTTVRADKTVITHDGPAVQAHVDQPKLNGG